MVIVFKIFWSMFYGLRIQGANGILEGNGVGRPATVGKYILGKRRGRMRNLTVISKHNMEFLKGEEKIVGNGLMRCFPETACFKPLRTISYAKWQNNGIAV